MEDFVTATDAARLLGLSRQGLYRRLKRPGAPEGMKIGNRRYFRRSEILTSLVLRLA